MAVVIRSANLADLGPIRDIYNHYVATSTCTFQVEPETHREHEDLGVATSGATMFVRNDSKVLLPFLIRQKEKK